MVAWLAVVMVLQGAVSDSGRMRDTTLVHECDRARPEWLFCDDFEKDRLGRYFEYADHHGSFRRADSVGLLGSHAMRAHFARGQVDAGSLKLALGRTPTPYMRSANGDSVTRYRELYWRVYLRRDPSWVGGGGDKLTRAQILDVNWAQAAAAQVWSGRGDTRDVLVLDPASGTDEGGALQTKQYNDFDRLRWLGGGGGRFPVFSNAHAGEWHCIEAHVRLNDPGARNGVFELWIDGTPEARRDGLNWVGRYDAYGLNVVFLENYWNDGAPASQSRYLDNFVVSTARIGCGAE